MDVIKIKTKKKKKEIPEKLKMKMEELENSVITCKLGKDNDLDILIADHEIYQYIRHRRSQYRMYDPLHKYKKIMVDKLNECLNEEELNFIKENKDNAIDFEIHMYTDPFKKSVSIKNILYKLLGIKLRTEKPDVDNFVKTAFDVMNGIFWTDDAQIVTLKASKSYSRDFNNNTIIRVKYKESGIEDSKGSLSKEEIKIYKNIIEKIKEKKAG